MAAKTSIEWCDASWSPIRARNRETGKIGWFCEHATPGSEHCYSEAFNRRLGTGIDFKAQNRDGVEIFLDEKILYEPLRWTRPRRIFVCSMTDWMADFVEDTWISEILRVVEACPQHTFQTLTKRAVRQRQYFDGLTIPFENLWLGISAEDQPRADERIPLLLDTPAAVRFLSVEPMLGPVNLEDAMDFREVEAADRIDWVIVGGESGSGARPMHPEWAMSVRDQCVAAGVPFFFKQWGNWRPSLGADDDYNTNPAERAAVGQNCDMIRVGKRAAGRLLDGREWSEYPAQERA